MKKIYILFGFVFFISNFSFTQTCGTVPLTLVSQYQLTTGNALPQTPVADRLNRPYVYVAAKDGGLLIFDVSTITSPTLVQTYTIDHFDSLHVMNAYQQGNYLFLALGNFFGTPLQKPGMAIVDVTNPLNPVVTDIWKDSVVTKGSAVITVQNNYAFLGAMTKGLVILDITDVHNIAFVSQYLPNPFFPLASPTSSQMPNARGMAISGNNLYLCYDAGGLRVIDITNKSVPLQIGQYINSGALNKQQAYNNIVLNGNLAYIAVDYCGMEIVDISNTNAITQVGWWNPYHCEGTGNLWLNSPGHMNQIAYLTADNAVFLSAGGSQLRVIDVSNQALPDSCNGYGVTNTQQGTWGIDVYNNKIYLANITSLIPFFSTWKGIKILDWASTVGIEEATNEVSSVTNYPNSFSTETEICFTLNHSACVNIVISDISGRNVKQFEYTKLNEGKKNIKWDGKNTEGNEVSDGMYFIKIQTENGLLNSKLLKLK